MKKNLRVRQQALDLCNVGLVREAFLAQVAQALGVLLGQDVAAANMSALDLAALGNLESLLCTAVRLDLRHIRLNSSLYVASVE